MSMTKERWKLFCDTVGEFLDAKYELGGIGPNYDCISFVYYFCCKCGYDNAPDVLYDINRDNYLEYYKNHKEDFYEEAITYYRSFGRIVPLEEMMEGDFVIVIRKDNVFVNPMFYIGKGVFLIISPKHGVYTANKELFNLKDANYTVEVIRWWDKLNDEISKETSTEK